MAKSVCKLCGAGFDDVGLAAVHAVDFHPGSDAAERAAARADKQRSADAAEAADSGGSDQGGDASPAGDPGASASGEAGTPPGA